MSTRKSTNGKTVTPKGEARSTLDSIGVKTIADWIASGKPYAHIAKEVGVSVGSLHGWIEADSERSLACACARERSAQTWDEAAEEVISSASNQFDLQKAKELAVHYRWRAKAVNPKRYGDRQQIDANVNVALYDPEQAKKMAALMNG